MDDVTIFIRDSLVRIETEIHNINKKFENVMTKNECEKNHIFLSDKIKLETNALMNTITNKNTNKFWNWSFKLATLICGSGGVVAWFIVLK